MEMGFTPRAGDEVKTPFGIGVIAGVRPDGFAVEIREDEVRSRKIVLRREWLTPSRKSYA